MSLTAGAFFSDLELKEHNMFTYPGSPESDIGFKRIMLLPIHRCTVINS